MPKKSSSSSPHRNTHTMKWIIEKLDDHERLLQNIYQLLREIRRDVDLNQQPLFLEPLDSFESDPAENVELQ